MDYRTGHIFGSGGSKTKKRNFWSNEELSVLKENYSRGIEAVAKMLPGRTIDSIQLKASKIGLSKAKGAWSREEIEYLIEHYSTDGLMCAEHLNGKTPHAIITKAERLGLRVERIHSWTEEEKRIIKDYYAEEGLVVMSRLPKKVSKHVVRSYASQMGAVPYHTHGWTEEENNLILEKFPLIGTAVALLLDRHPIKSSLSHISEMGLREGGFGSRNKEPWVLKEEEQIANFYCSSGEDWLDYVEDFIDTFGTAKHSFTSVMMKIANYSYMHTGLGLSHSATLSKVVFRRIAPQYGITKTKLDNTYQRS